MIKEAKNIDFYTTGKQPSEQDFVRISEWIKKEKDKQSARKQTNNRQNKSTSPNISIVKSEA